MPREKGASPFHPGQPVPAELFVGRKEQIDRILRRGAAQTAAGKPTAFYVQGEYGIGKSSIANYVQRAAEKEYGLFPVYATLGGESSVEDFIARVMEGVIVAGGYNPTFAERVKGWLGQYIGKQELFGFTVNLEALKQEAPSIATPPQLLGFLRETMTRLGDGVRGISLVLDELNGIVNNPKFGHFLKELIETNSRAKPPLPLLLMLCGVEERRRTMIRHHPPVERLFSVVEIEKMSQEEMEEFFSRSFRQAEMTVAPGAMSILTQYSAGLPKIMHVIGEEAYYVDRDGQLSADEASLAIVRAADEVGQKYVDQQVYKAIRTDEYRSILKKIAELDPLTDGFHKKEIETGLTPAEKTRLNNFLQRMKQLDVLKSGDKPGEYIFNVQMVRVYIWLQSRKDARPSQKGTPPATD